MPSMSSRPFRSRTICRTSSVVAVSGRSTFSEKRPASPQDLTLDDTYTLLAGFSPMRTAARPGGLKPFSFRAAAPAATSDRMAAPIALPSMGLAVIFAFPF